MRIGYFADGAWAHLALERLLSEPNLEIVFIVPRYDMQDPVLRQYAEKLGVPFIAHPDVNSTEFIESVKLYEADLFISMSFNQILKRSIIDLSPKGFINCHAGALPYYRGRNILNWALINGEDKFGVTVHYVDDGIDTGDIIEQEFVEITPTDTYGSVLEKAIELCAATLIKSVRVIVGNEAGRTPQSSIHPVGFYCGMRRIGDEWMDWQWSSKRLHDFIRGISLPGPCARTMCAGNPLAVIQSEMIEDAPDYLCTPGEVVGRNTRGAVIKTADNTLLITRVADVSGEGELLNRRIPEFRIGTRLGLNPTLEVMQAQRRIGELEKEVQRLRTIIEGTGS